MNTEVLEEIGLTKSEIKTYLALLELGQSHVGAIISKSDLQSSVVHRALNSLISKGIVSYILKGKNKIYKSSDPEYFLNFVKSKEKRIEDILPLLKEKQRSEKETKTTMYKGKMGIKEVYSKLLSLKEKELLSFGGSKNTTDFMGIEWWKQMYMKRIYNKLSQRHIASDETLSYIGPFLKMKNTKIKFLPKETFGQYQETAIVGDYVAITIFAEEGYSILIHNKEIADGYRKNFELLWKLAKS